MTNTEIVLTAMRELFEEKDLTAIDRYWAEPYTQHVPYVPSGVDVLRTLVPTLEGFTWTPHRTAEQGDLVFTHSRVLGLGPAPMIVASIFRLDNGRIVEHWEVAQPEVPASDTVDGLPVI